MRADPSSLNAPAGGIWDVVVCGAGLAGLTPARRLRRELPQLAHLARDVERGPGPVRRHAQAAAARELLARGPCSTPAERLDATRVAIAEDA